MMMNGLNNDSSEPEHKNIKKEVIQNDIIRLLKKFFMILILFSITIFPKLFECQHEDNKIDNSVKIKFDLVIKLVPKENLGSIFFKRGIIDTNRLGWYQQQFLKMGYSRICKNDYYLIWDSDTFPTKKIEMFENGTPIFDMKTEHHSAYFITMNHLFDNLHKSKYSYISEHMIIKTEFMKKLLDDIENNKKIPGKMFWEKILISIDKSDINKSGFSEFETYGSYVDTKFPNFYKHRKWNSKRDMTIFYGNISNMDENDFNWVSKDYDAITFEKRYKFDEQNFKYIKNLEIHKLYRSKKFFKFYKRIIKKYNKIKK